MSKPFVPKVATTNDLLHGDVIYFTDTGWSRDLADAKVATTQSAADDLLATASGYPLQTVGVYLADVTVHDDVPTPAHFREIFRTQGPSNYFHGKQASHV